AELMHRRKAAQKHPVSQMYMASQSRIVGENDVIAQLAIVRDMHVSHDPVIAAQAGNAFVLHCAAIDGDALAYRVAITDDQLRRFIRILLVLRRGAYGGKLENLVVAPYRGVTFNHHMRADTGTGADLHMRAYDRISADLDRVIDLGGRIDQRSRMNRHTYCPAA